LEAFVVALIVASLVPISTAVFVSRLSASLIPFSMAGLVPRLSADFMNCIDVYNYALGRWFGKGLNR